jgi:membrane-bound ClpP family serine protease
MLPLLPNEAFALLAAGVAGCIWELTRPGRIAPGVAGLGAVVIGAYWLWRNHPTYVGLFWIGLTGIGFSLLPLTGAFCPIYVIAGLAGSIGWSAGFILLFRGASRIAPELAIPVCTAFSCIAAWLLRTAMLGLLRKRTE